MKEDKAHLFRIRLAALALLGGAVVYWMSGPCGLGVAADSIAYTQAARNILLGNGLMFFDQAGNLSPMGSYPPVFPVILSGAWFLGLSFAEWSRVLNAFLFGGSLLLAGGIVYRVRGSALAAFVTVAAFIASVHILQSHGMLVAEPLLVVAALAWFRLMLLFNETGSRRVFYAAAFGAGLAVLTGYSGLALVLAGVSWLWFKGRPLGRVRDAVLFLIAALILPLVWFVRNAVLAGGVMGEGAAQDVRLPERLMLALNAFSVWLLPSRVWPGLRWAVLAAALVLVIKLLKSHCGFFTDEVKRAMSLALLFSGIYILLGLSGGVTMHGGMVLDHQALLPVYAMLALVIGFIFPLTGCPAVVVVPGKPWSACRTTAAVVLGVFFALGLARTVKLAIIHYKNGSGYSSKAVGSSKLAETLRSLDDRVPLYSNDPSAAYYFAGRPAVRIPEAGMDLEGLPSRQVMADDFSRRRAVAVVFSSAEFHPVREWTGLGLVPLFKDAAGNIFGTRKK